MVTGEDTICEKKIFTKDNFRSSLDATLFASSVVVEGSGIAMVIFVGENSNSV